jgi:hypothetical protein
MRSSGGGDIGASDASLPGFALKRMVVCGGTAGPITPLRYSAIDLLAERQDRRRTIRLAIGRMGSLGRRERTWALLMGRL